MRKDTKSTPKRKKKPSEKKIHRVYCTYFPDGRYYIGYSCKSSRLFEKYFGSSKLVTEYKGQLRKEVIREYDSKNEAKFTEMLLQLQQMKDDQCLNDMIHIRLRMKYLQGYERVHWTPEGDTRSFVPRYIRD